MRDLVRGADGLLESEFGGVAGLRQPSELGAVTPYEEDVVREMRQVDPMDADTTPEFGTGERVV